MLVERSILVKKLVVDIYVHWFYECKNQMKKKNAQITLQEPQISAILVILKN